MPTAQEIKAEEKSIIEEIVAPLGLEYITERDGLKIAKGVAWSAASILTAPITIPTMFASAHIDRKKHGDKYRGPCHSRVAYMCMVALSGPSFLKGHIREGNIQFYQVDEEQLIEPDDVNPRVKLSFPVDNRKNAWRAVDITFPDGISIGFSGSQHRIQRYDLNLEEKCVRDEKGMLWSPPNARGVRYGMEQKVEYVNSLYKEVPVAFPCDPALKEKLDTFLARFEEPLL